MNDKKFYITTTLPYVNAAPHIGFALEIVQADAIARWKKMRGYEVIFNTGTDEHGLKIYRKAIEEGKDPQAYTDEYAPKFDRLKSALDLAYTNFIRTTDVHHMHAAQELWKRCAEHGDIYKKKYKGLYCVGDEMFLKESDILNGKCVNHPAMDPIEIEEENYFFRLSAYQNKLLEYFSKENVIMPEWRRREAIKFVESGLEDFSISREKTRLPWGVPVPGDEAQVMYVWFDALTNYISTLGWPEDREGLYNEFWNNGTVVQAAGKDQVRFQSIMWQAMLMSAGIKTSDTVLYHGHITSGGQKMSKSVGNVVDPFEIVEKHGTDALRYWLLRDMPTFEDGDFTWERFIESYNANLANGLGNLVSRVVKMARSYNVTIRAEDIVAHGKEAYEAALNTYEFQKAMNAIWERIQITDKFIQETEPFKTIKTDPEKAKRDVKELLESVWEIGVLLEPLLPETSEKIVSVIEDASLPMPTLFPRIV
jgi:methionyl-tRNA synthetase